MTRIGWKGEGPVLPPALPEAEARRSPARDDRDLAGRGRSPGRDAGLETGLDRGGAGAFGHGLGEDLERRRSAFDERMREALCATVQDAKSGPKADEREEQTRRLLAVAGETVQPLGAHPFVAGIAAAEAPHAVSAGARAEAIADRVEAALMADLRGDGAGALSLTIPLGAQEFGIDAVTVAMTGDVIEVTLLRATTAPAADMLAAAQALADRLQQRFSKRTVRVLDAEPPSRAAEPADGLGRLGALLGGRKPVA